MLSFPNAKINIGLYITEKRPDGFHNLESCFYPVGWSDVLEIMPAQKLSFKSTGIEIPGNPETNLCLKAYRLVSQDFKLPPVMIHLHKIVPIGAGLGGGSADCAFTIKTLNDLFELNMSVEMMENYARQLGSDCAFFVRNCPQLAKGRGEILNDISLNLGGYFLKIINPGIHISTKEAFSDVHKSGKFGHLVESIAQPKVAWRDLILNDFEQHLFRNQHELSEIKTKCYSEGAFYASMSGSGSTMFALYEFEPKLSFEKFPLEKVYKLENNG